MTERVYNILYLCTGNSARSILAEGLTNMLAGGGFRAYSAGSHPAGQINPYAVELLRRINYPTEELRSKSWDEFAKPEAPRMDFVITVCDKAAGEVCPFWPGQPMTAHWGFADPAAVKGTDAEKRAAFERIFRQINNRLRVFLALPLEKIDRLALQQKIKAIGEEPPG